MKPSKFHITPSLMRIILSATLVIILIASAVGFTYVQRELLGFAKEISRSKVDATASNTTISSLEKVRSDLENYNDVAQKAQALRANDEFPEFRVIDEIKRIANRNNIPVADFSYNDSTADSSTTTPPATTTPQTTTPATPPTNSSSAGKTISLTVNFDTIDNYNDYLQFLYDIEQNIPKLKIKSAGISNSNGAQTDTSQQQAQQSQPEKSNGFTVDPITVELYVR